MSPSPPPFTSADLDALVRDFLDHSAALLLSKGQEYAGANANADRLRNFRDVAAFTGQRPEEVCATYFMKHVQAITHAVHDDRYTWAYTLDDGSEGLKQRICDGVNYLLLLAAILEAKERAKAPGGA
jgi:hypothetical protein